MRPAVEIHDTSLRDSIGDFVTFHVHTDELADILGILDRTGFASIDVFGGSTFFPTLKVLGEDPWQRLRAIRRAVTRTPLQAVLRGRLVFGSRPTPAGTTRAVLHHLRDLGVDRIKVVDPGLDLSGARDVVALAKDAGFHVTASVVISYGFTANAGEILVAQAQVYASAGADAIGLQDPFGVLPPARLADLVRAYRRHQALPLRLHLHDANLLGVASLETGLREGAAAADTTISAVSWAYSPPQTESVAMALRGTALDAGLDPEALEEASAWFEEAKARKGFRYKAVYGVDHGALRGDMPSAVRRALGDDLRERGRMALLDAALKEAPRVWEALGRPPLLSPFVQAVCGQAIENVLAGGDFARLDPRVATYLRGDYGAPRPGTRPDLLARARAEEPKAPPGLLDIGELSPEGFRSEDDRLTFALFPDVAHDFFKLRDAGGLRSTPAPLFSLSPQPAPARQMLPRSLLLNRRGEAYEVSLDGLGPREGNRRTFFLRIGGEAAKVEVSFPAAGEEPVYTVHHHGRPHRIEFLEILPPTKHSLPVILNEDGHQEEILYGFPRAL